MNKADASPSRAVIQESDDPGANILVSFGSGDTDLCFFYTGKQFSYPKKGNKTVELCFSDLYRFS